MSRFKANLLLIIAAFFWGSNFVAQSVGMSYIGPFTYGTLRYSIGALILIPIVMISIRKTEIENPQLDRKQYIRSSVKGGIWCGVAMAIATNLQQLGLTETSADKAGFLTSLYIVIVPLLGILKKQKVTKQVWFSVLIATIGFYLLSVKSDFYIERGDLLVLFCAFAYAGQIMAVDQFAKDTDPFLLTMIQFTVAAVVSFILTVIFETVTLSSILACWFPIFYSAVFACVLADTFQVVAQKYSEAAVASLLMSLESVFAALSALVIQHVIMSPREFAGCVLIFIAVILSQIPISFFLKKILSETGLIIFNDNT